MHSTLDKENIFKIAAVVIEYFLIGICQTILGKQETPLLLAAAHCLMNVGVSGSSQCVFIKGQAGCSTWPPQAIQSIKYSWILLSHFYRISLQNLSIKICFKSGASIVYLTYLFYPKIYKDMKLFFIYILASDK